MPEIEIFNKIEEYLPERANIAGKFFEGANIVLYTKNLDFLLNSRETITDIVNKIKKRIEVRAHSSLLLPEEQTRNIIEELIPKEAILKDMWFEEGRSVVYIEVEKPGLAIGKQGQIIQEIKKRTGWTPIIKRAPQVKSDLIKTIRIMLHKYSKFRREFLHELGLKIYAKWERKPNYWVRVSILGAGREVGRSAILLQTPLSNILLDCGVNPVGEFPYLDAPEFDISKLDAIIVSHAHLDHSGLIPFLYKLGYEGPVYSTEPTRDIMTLLQIDFIDVSQKEGREPIYSSKEISEMLKRSITLDYGEVTDIRPDVRLTFYNAGHILGSSMIHLNIGDGFHNLLYTGDFKYSKTKLLDPPPTKFQRVESLIIESTYGGKENIQPEREESENLLIQIIRETIERGGKVLIPVLANERAQEIMLVIEEAIRRGDLKEIPIYLDGMLWDITIIHTAYPEFLNSNIRKLILTRDHNPFLVSYFKRVGSKEERDKIIEGGPCVILATSGMLEGGPSVYYFNKLADDKKNSIIFVSYQGKGTLGRRIQEGEKEIINVFATGKREIIKVNLEVYTIEGFSAHSDRKQLLKFLKDLQPKPRKIITVHGEPAKCIDLASSIYKNFRIETVAPRNLEAIRLR